MTQNPHYQLNWRDGNADKTVTAREFGTAASAWGWETSPLSLGMQMSLVHLTSFHDPCRSPSPTNIPIPPTHPHTAHPAPLGPHDAVCHSGPGHSIATCPTERGNGIVQSFTSPALQLTESIKQTRPNTHPHTHTPASPQYPPHYPSFSTSLLSLTLSLRPSLFLSIFCQLCLYTS